MIEGRPRDSLVQYENPIEVHLLYLTFLRFQEEATLTIQTESLLDVSNSNLNIKVKKKAQLPPMETKPSSEDITNAILPPREWAENGTI